MTESAPINRSTSIMRWFTERSLLRAVRRRHEERRKFIEESDRVLSDLKNVTEDLKRTISGLREATDDILERLGRAVTRLDDIRTQKPSYGELLCAELIAYWKSGKNWKSTALITLEALADDGKGQLAQWAARELTKDKTMALSTSDKLSSQYRFEKLATEGVALDRPKKDKDIRQDPESAAEAA